PRGVQILQPMFGRYKALPSLDRYYNNDYVKTNSLDFEHGVGKLYIDQEHTVTEYTEHESETWTPLAVHSHDSLLAKMAARTAKLQFELLSNAGSLDRLSESHQKAIKNETKVVKRITDLIIKMTDDRDP